MCVAAGRAALHAQTTPLPPYAADPANLRGERVAPQALADTLPIDHGAAALQQLLLKLGTRASLMMIVAHPDDEDGGMLTTESRGAGARVAMLTLTRGEGGQNLMSADFGEALGLIRTQELLAADRYLGVDQLFGTEVDFGFSKTREETFGQWTHERVLYDAVRAVRLYRPLVLASVFVGGPTDGHGHHQVSGEITQEVFLAAADPKVFPEMGLPPWAPLKVFARVPFARVSAQGMFDYATGETVPTHFHNYITGVDRDTVPEAMVEVHEGTPAEASGKPALGMDGLSYLQFARRGLGLQKTQIGAGVRLAPAGVFDSGYTLMGSRLGCPSGTCQPSTAREADLFSGIDTSVAALADLLPSAPPAVGLALRRIQQDIHQGQELFDAQNLELTAPPLRSALRTIDELIASLSGDAKSYDLLHELRIKRVQLNDALVLAHRLSLKAVRTEPATGDDLLTTTTKLAARLSVTNGGAHSMEIQAVRLRVNLAGEGNGSGYSGRLEPRSTRELEVKLPYLAGLAATRPYFSRPDEAQPYYNIAVPVLRNAPMTPDPIVAEATLDDQGVRLELAAIVPAAQAHSSAAQPVDEAQPRVPAQPLVVVPPVSVDLTRTVALLPVNAAKNFQLPFRLRLFSGQGAPCPAEGTTATGGKVQVQLPAGWTAEPAFLLFPLDCTGMVGPLSFSVQAPADTQDDSASSIQILAREAGRWYGDSLRAVGYPGLSYTNLYTAASMKAVSLEVKTAPGLRVGYVAGTGDSVASFLPELGVTPTPLTLADLTGPKLAGFDTVVLGVRAYSAHPELAGSGSRELLDYARSGGVVIVQYNNGIYGADSAPYPIAVPGDSAHNVVVEADPVAILEPRNPLMVWPNTLTANDFAGWIEERGHGFAATWDPHYSALLEMHDPGQSPQRGGLLVVQTGKGAYVYVALALYRQLPEGVPGAYRLFANLLSLGRNPGLHAASNGAEGKP